MKRLDERVGERCENGAGADHWAIRGFPSLPQSSKSQGFTILGVDIGRKSSVAVFLPLVKSVRQHQATPFLECRPECRLGGGRLSNGIDHTGSNLQILGPEWNQTPSHHLAPSLTVVGDGQHRLGRCDVVSRAMIKEFRVGELG